MNILLVVYQLRPCMNLNIRRVAARRHASRICHPIQEERTPGYYLENFLPVRVGQICGDRYQIMAKLGYGTTSTVWLAKDVHRWKLFGDKFYTPKILTKDYTKSQKISELDISQILNETNPGHEGFQYMRTVQGSFLVNGPAGNHMCLLYRPMRETLATFKRRLEDERITPSLLKAILLILLKSLNYLHDECRIIHTDLKPDNILVGIEDKGVIKEMVEHERSDPAPTKQVDNDRVIYLSRNFGQLRGVPGEPKISDFGLAVPSAGPHYHPIQPDLFQAPEVILRAGWSFPADIWNLGVMLWDLLESQTLFQAKDSRNDEYRADLHLQEMIAFLGSPPTELLHRGRATSEYFSSKEGTLLTSSISPRSNSSLGDTITVLEGEDKRQFLRFVGRILTWLPEERATAKELLSDPWLKC